MAVNNNRNIKYVYELPYFERRELCRILDQHDTWEELGGVYMKFDMLTIHSLRREVRRGYSPTDELLTLWGTKNHTVLELFALLSRMQHYQAMLVIKDFVDKEYHRLIYEGEQNLSRLISKKEIRAPQTTPQIEGAVGPLPVYTDALHNINQSQSSNELPEKMAFLTNNNYNAVLLPPEEKILNIDVNQRSNGSSSSNGNNAQTIKINENRRSPRQLSPSTRPESVNRERRLSNASGISSIAESVGTLPHITFKELEKATNGWHRDNILGKGGFGTVYKGIWKNTYVAIKRTRNTETDEHQTIQIQQILGELKMLNSYRHDNILPLYGFSIGGEDPCLISQYMPNGSLEDRLQCRQNTKPLTWQQRLYIATGTARGLQFLHTIGEKPLIHGDIKSGNILLDSNYEPRIGDFGLAREGPYNHYTHMQVSRVHGTRPYLPEEFLRAKKFSTKVDTYSFGIVLFELGTGLRAYDDQRKYKYLKEYVENYETQLDIIIDKKIVQDDHSIYIELMKLGVQCVSRKPKDRPEMVNVLEKLNHMTSTREMVVRVQGMIRTNSLTPSNPYELQLLHDFIRKSSISSSQPPTSVPLVESHQLFRTPSPNNPFLVPSDYLSNKENIIVPPPNQVEETPKIAISPPSDHHISTGTESTDSSTESEEIGAVGPVDHVSNQDEDFSYADTPLPLISVLGVKNNQQNEASGTENKSQEILTTAAGKKAWILE